MPHLATIYRWASSTGRRHCAGVRHTGCAAHTGRRFSGAVPGRRRATSVRHHLADGYAGAFDAAIRDARLALILLPLRLLSGNSTPRASMPQLVQEVMLAAPTTHFVAAG